MTHQRYLPRPQATAALGAQIAAILPRSCYINLTGELGAGKTTLVRGLLRALGHAGPVRSPTFTLIEPYQVGECCLYHLDLYRLADPEELEYIGLRDLLREPAILLIEWPERGAGALPAPDLVIALRVAGTARAAELAAPTPTGARLLAQLPED